MNEISLLRTVAAGATLKVHRTADGLKEYRLHHLSGAAEVVDSQLVDRLVKRGRLDSNMKFPAATFLLTAEGRQAIT